MTVSAGHCVQRAATQEELEKHRESERRREDTLQPLACLCAAPLQAHAALCHGRNRCRARCAICPFHAPLRGLLTQPYLCVPLALDPVFCSLTVAASVLHGSGHLDNKNAGRLAGSCLTPKGASLGSRASWPEIVAAIALLCTLVCVRPGLG